jgi:hypothetical protein
MCFAVASMKICILVGCCHKINHYVFPRHVLGLGLSTDVNVFAQIKTLLLIKMGSSLGPFEWPLLWSNEIQHKIMQHFL